MTSIESDSRRESSNMNDNITPQQQPFTPSLGLKWWMNKMKKTSSDNNKNSSSSNTNHNNPNNNNPMDLYSSQENRKSGNDTLSTVSISELTTATGGSSFFGISSHYGHEVDSSLRVLGPGGANSEISSIFSADVQSNASIRSKPWISKELSPNHIDGHSEFYHDEDDEDEDDEDNEESDDHNNNNNKTYDEDDNGDKRENKNNNKYNEPHNHNHNQDDNNNNSENNLNGKKYNENEKPKNNNYNINNNVQIKIEDCVHSQLADSHNTTESFATNQEYQPLYSIDDQRSSFPDEKQRQWGENGNSAQRLAKIKAGLFFNRK
ncbi:unnamed protein product [Cunninghamella blakesleeana]